MSGAATGPNRRNIEAIHPLSPMQSSLLFTALRGGPSSDPGFLQLRCTLAGDLDASAFDEAWRRVVGRHASLRAAIHWRNVDRPLQVTFRRVEPEWTIEDWRDATPVEMEARWRAFLEADRTRALDLSRPPVMRLARFRTGEQEWRLVWSCHHVLLDGWSGSLVLSEVLDICNALRRGVAAELPDPRPYHEYVAWLARRDPAESEAYWRRALGGLAEPTPLPFADARSAASGAGFGRLSVELAEEASRAIEQSARQNRVTPGTLIHGAWTAVLAAGTSRRDVCFGTTVSGRSAPLQGIETMVGLFISSLPVRVSVTPEATVPEFLQQLQAQLAELRAHEHDSPSQIQMWSGIPGHRRLFDSLVVFENFPATGATDPAAALRLQALDGGITTTYPVTVIGVPGKRFGLHLIHDRSSVTDETAREMLDALSRMLEAVAAQPACRMSDLLAMQPSGSGRSASLATQSAPPVADRAHSAGAAGSHPPRDDLEMQLVQIWEDVLDVQPIGIRDDFFDLGGNSLNVAQLFDRIERFLGKRLPLATMFEVPTVALLADRFRDRGWTPPWSSLVAMQREGSLPPVFCVHSYEGHLLFYRDLARRLAPGQPVWGLQSVGLDGSRPPLTSVEEMAAHYLAELRTVQPTGPYRLVGMCFGIAVVFEMAQQLLAGGEGAAELIILDSGFLTRLPAPAPNQPVGTLATRVFQRARAHARGLRARSQRVITRMAESEWERIARRVREANERAFFRYEARRFAGRVTLIRSEEYGTRQDWHLKTWSELAESVEAHVVPGDHFRMLQEPYVRHLADVMIARLAGADRAAGPDPAATAHAQQQS